MKVAELIELLQFEDPELNVWVSDGFVVHDVEIKHFKDKESLTSPSLVDKAGDVVIYYPCNFR